MLEPPSDERQQEHYSGGDEVPGSDGVLAPVDGAGEGVVSSGRGRSVIPLTTGAPQYPQTSSASAEREENTRHDRG
jgi:hypothetical protein